MILIAMMMMMMMMIKDEDIRDLQYLKDFIGGEKFKRHNMYDK